MIGDRVMQIKQLLDQLGIKSNPMEMFLHEWRNINESKVTEMEIDQSDSSLTELKPDNDNMLQHVSVWPMFETIMAMFGRYLLFSVGERDVSTCDVETFTEFCVQYTPVSPIQIHSWRLAVEKTVSNFVILKVALSAKIVNFCYP